MVSDILLRELLSQSIMNGTESIRDNVYLLFEGQNTHDLSINGTYSFRQTFPILIKVTIKHFSNSHQTQLVFKETGKCNTQNFLEQCKGRKSECKYDIFGLIFPQITCLSKGL